MHKTTEKIGTETEVCPSTELLPHYKVNFPAVTKLCRRQRVRDPNETM